MIDIRKEIQQNIVMGTMICSLGHDWHHKMPHCGAKWLVFIPLSPWVIGCGLSQTPLGEVASIVKGNFLEKGAAVNTEPPIFIATGEYIYQPGEKGSGQALATFTTTVDIKMQHF